MGWNIDLSKYIVAVAPFGGPIGKNIIIFFKLYDSCETKHAILIIVLHIIIMNLILFI